MPRTVTTTDLAQERSRLGIPGRAAILAMLLLAGGPADARQRPNPCRIDPAYRAFDFWLGSFTVAPFAEPERVVGHNRISLAADGCALLEQWEGASGGHGVSISRLDPITRRWAHHWAAPGCVIDLEGGPDDSGAMVMTGTISYADARGTRPFTGRWAPLGDGQVRQTFREQDPETGTWRPWFDGLHVPIAKTGADDVP
ncbi:MAG: hypothetical protein KatS3mg119_1803 [Rhodothalassiaceae bacterium]|nr:MAG: hypothetical protein KatS3mg119_1803 [Rhodothalassiaceae bacterium]